MSRVYGLKCDWCGQELKQDVTHFHKGYQGQDYTSQGPEHHEQPKDCIKYLASVQKMDKTPELNISEDMVRRGYKGESK